MDKEEKERRLLWITANPASLFLCHLAKLDVPFPKGLGVFRQDGRLGPLRVGHADRHAVQWHLRSIIRCTLLLPQQRYQGNVETSVCFFFVTAAYSKYNQECWDRLRLSPTPKAEGYGRLVHQMTTSPDSQFAPHWSFFKGKEKNNNFYP